VGPAIFFSLFFPFPPLSLPHLPCPSRPPASPSLPFLAPARGDVAERHGDVGKDGHTDVAGELAKRVLERAVVEADLLDVLEVVAAKEAMAVSL
jgi:hypothetical protein